MTLRNPPEHTDAIQPLGPPIRQAAPAPAPSPAPLKAPQPATMTEADVPMIIRDCYAKQSKLNELQRADWLRMSAEPAGFDVAPRIVDQDARNREMTEALRRVHEAGWIEACTAPYGEQAELHPRRHLDWPVIDPDMIEQAPRRRAAWLPEGHNGAANRLVPEQE